MQRNLLSVFLLLIASSLLLLLYYYNYTGEIMTTKDYSYLMTISQLTESEEVSALTGKLPNLPVKYWYAHKNLNMQFNDTCALFPNILTFDYVHSYWQQFTTSNGTFKLFGAYLDDRTETNQVRILAMINRRRPSVRLFCQLWFNDNHQPVIVPVYEFLYLWYEGWSNPENGYYQPYLMSCALPQDISFGIPSAVSLSESFCDTATNSLKVNYNKPKVKKNFAVCIKGMNFLQDVSVRLIEWIELLVILGVDKIYFYDIMTHPNVTNLLRHYERKDIVGISSLTLSQIQLNEPILEHMYLDHEANLQSETIPYNDCFLKHMNEYDYISVLDIDEMIMPHGDLVTWMDLVQKMREKVTAERGVEASSYVARNCYYFDNATHANMQKIESFDEHQQRGTLVQDVPVYMHMMQHVYRSMNCTLPGYYVKSIHNTRAVLAVHNHLPFATVSNKFQTFDIDLDDGYMHHYRTNCPGELQPVCYNDYRKDLLFDTTIFKYKDTLKDKVMETLDTLGYF